VTYASLLQEVQNLSYKTPTQLIETDKTAQGLTIDKECSARSWHRRDTTQPTDRGSLVGWINGGFTVPQKDRRTCSLQSNCAPRSVSYTRKIFAGATYVM